MDATFIGELIRPIDYNDEWGQWECPNCGEEHDDPAGIFLTTCRECGIEILLSVIDNGQRDAWVAP